MKTYGTNDFYSMEAKKKHFHDYNCRLYIGKRILNPLCKKKIVFSLELTPKHHQNTSPWYEPRQLSLFFSLAK